MTVAVSILLFLCAALSLYEALRLRSYFGVVSLAYLASINICAGIAGMVYDYHSLKIGIGVLLSAWAIIALLLLIMAVAKAIGGRGIDMLVMFAALLYFLWVAAFAVLQFAVVA